MLLLVGFYELDFCYFHIWNSWMTKMSKMTNYATCSNAHFKMCQHLMYNLSEKHPYFMLFLIHRLVLHIKKTNYQPNCISRSWNLIQQKKKKKKTFLIKMFCSERKSTPGAHLVQPIIHIWLIPSPNSPALFIGVCLWGGISCRSRRSCRSRLRSLTGQRVRRRRILPSSPPPPPLLRLSAPVKHKLTVYIRMKHISCPAFPLVCFSD